MVRSGLRCVASSFAVVSVLAACSEPAQTPAPKPPVAPVGQYDLAPPPSAPQPPVLAQVPAPEIELSQEAQSINLAAFAAAVTPELPASAKGVDPLLLKAQVLLDRAHFSPGVIDGKNGSNVRLAVAGFEEAKGLPIDGKLDEAVWAALTGGDSAPVMQGYVITAQDVAGPFIGVRPDAYEDLAKLPAVGFERASEALAEKFHMDEDLLLALNPDSGFAAGQTITVAAIGSGKLGGQVASIRVDKGRKSLRAYDAAGALLALYPASVGSKEYPAPDGAWAVRAVAPNPVYYYNPERLTFGRDKVAGKLEIKAGPNNPVGATWIDLTRDTYGIHGTPDPEAIGKQQSHGCVRLTNWDVAELAAAVKAGTKVTFFSGKAA